MIKKLKYLKSSNRNLLEDAVNELIAAGWQPSGPLNVGSSMDEERYTQAMVLYSNPEVPVSPDQDTAPIPPFVQNS